MALHADGLLALWTRRPEALQPAFAAHGDYLASTEGALDLRDYGPALGRRFRALKLWTVLRCYGREGLQALIREHVRLAALFEEWVRDEPGWEVSAPRHFSTVCFRHASADNDELARRATATGADLRRDDAAARRERDPARDRQRAHAGGGRPAALGGAARVRAVIFDLWDTLVDVAGRRGREAARAARRGARRRSGAEEFGRRWRESYRASQTGPLADVLPRRSACRTSTSTAQVAARHEFGRRVLRLRAGARGGARASCGAAA